MKNPCEQFVEWLETESGELPPSLRAHLDRCVHCQHEYALHSAYQKAVQAVRSEPVPATQVQWSQIAQRLKAPQARPRWAWRGVWAPALAFGAMAGLGILFWLTPRNHPELARLEQTNPKPFSVGTTSTQSTDTPLSSDGSVLPMPPPTYSDSVVPFSGSVEEPAEPSQRATTSTRELKSEPSPHRREMAMASPEGATSFARNGAPDLRNINPTFQPLEMEPIVPQGGENADYLSVNYNEASQTEATPSDAIICSF